MSNINPKIVEEARKVIRESAAGARILGEDPVRAPGKKEKPVRKSSGDTRSVTLIDILAMMLAVFMVLWLTNARTDEARHAVDLYFAPGAPVLTRLEPAAGPRLDNTATTRRGTGTVVILAAADQGHEAASTGTGAWPSTSTSGGTTTLSTAALRAREAEKFADVEARLTGPLGSSAAMRKLAQHVVIERTAAGLRIELTDRPGLAMFPRGSSRMHSHMRLLLLHVAETIADLPNPISVTGHLDPMAAQVQARAGAGDLSANRAIASRRVLIDAGIPETRISRVMGQAGNEPLLRDDPGNPRNRRISILVASRHAALN